MRISSALLFVYLMPSYAQGEICKYVDESGHTTYSDVAVPSAQKVQCFQNPESVSPSSPPDGLSTPPAPTVREPDNGRRRILEEQLASEQQALETARNALAAQEGIRFGNEHNYARVLERLKPYQDAVVIHEKNVALLRQELANLR